MTSKADLRQTDFWAARLVATNFDQAKIDASSRGLVLYCPAEGPFLGYKKAFNQLLIQLLIPADAKRSSATTNACRCSKAKVLAIYDPITLQRYSEAQSLVDAEFVYRTGHWVYPDAYTDDHFVASTHGIHFWMTRAEALAYL